MAPSKVVVIGTSAGGIGAMIEIVNALPETGNASLFFVQHIYYNSRNYLPELLQMYTRWKVIAASDGCPIEAGCIYLPPPDRHMELQKHSIRVFYGPKENFHRPAINPLFRSAAYNFKTRAIGIILTGALDDGTNGLWCIKANGGIAIVQDPQDAMYPEMPRNAIRYVNVDYVVPLLQIPHLLAHLLSRKTRKWQPGLIHPAS